MKIPKGTLVKVISRDPHTVWGGQLVGKTFVTLDSGTPIRANLDIKNSEYEDLKVLKFWNPDGGYKIGPEHVEVVQTVEEREALYEVY